MSASVHAPGWRRASFAPVLALALSATPAAAQAPAPSAAPTPEAAAPEAAAPEATAPEATAPEAAAPGEPAAPVSAGPVPAPAEAVVDALLIEPLEPLDASGAAELAKLTAELGGGDGAAQGLAGPPRVSLYGFADFTYSQPLRESFLAGTWGTFAVGNANVYLASELGAGWRSLLEVRFTYLPHGSVPAGQPLSAETRTNSSYPDYVDLGRPMNVGGIEFERAWVEYRFHPRLTVRAGQFLSPYGVWNVDHGSPVYIGVVRPFVVGEEIIPERQTGLEAYGAVYLDATKVGYHLTLSNGRGPIDAYRDLDHNKAVGGRVYVRNDSWLGALQLGASFYAGRYTDRGPDVVTFNPDGTFVAEHPITSRFDELSLAADLKWELGPLLIQSEFAIQQKAFVGQGRPLNPFSPAPALTADHLNIGSYLLLAYRTPFFYLTPYVTLEHLYQGDQPDLREPVAFIGGLNHRPTPNVVLKAQYTLVRFPGQDTSLFSGTAEIDLLAFQVAWSF